MRRYGLRDDQCGSDLSDFLPGRERARGRHGGRSIDCLSRPFSTDLELRCPWRDLPRSGLADWKTIHQRFQPVGEERGFRGHLQNCWPAITTIAIHDDRRHHCARPSTQRRCARKNGAQAIGRSRGGLTTKIHVLVDALGNPFRLMLTPGQDHDLTGAEPLLEEDG